VLEKLKDLRADLSPMSIMTDFDSHSQYLCWFLSKRRPAWMLLSFSSGSSSENSKEVLLYT
jgi:hypothetical protein